MNDQRVTQYALGELTGSARDEFERDLAVSETLQRDLNETIKLAEALGTLTMNTEILPEEKRAALRRQCAENQRVFRGAAKIVPFLVAGGLATAAACLLLAPAIFQKKAPEKFVPEVAAVPVNVPKPSPLNSPVQMTIADANAPHLLKEGQSFLESGRFDLAAKRFEQVLAENKENIDARRGLERINEARQIYSTQAYNETRANQIRLAERGWERPVRRFQAGASTIIEAPVDEKAAAGAPVPASTSEGIALNGNPGNLSDAEFKKQVDAQIAASISSGLAAAGAAPATPFIVSNAAKPASGPAEGRTAITGFNDGWGKGSGAGGESDKASALGDVPLQGRLFRDTGDSLQRRQFADHNTEAYAAVQENVFLLAKDNPLSTFSIDVDTASYANVRRFLQNDQVPPLGAIRTEELVNYFPYKYPQPEGGVPFSVNLEVSHAPWDGGRELVRIGLKGREIPASERAPANLVFLCDVSGSMDQPDKLPLLQRSLAALVENLSPKDRVAIVVYAGSSGLVLPSTPGTEKPRILEALEKLKAGGSTNGGEGIRLAYNIAREHFLTEGNNRVILCTDGDFNVGTASESQLVRLIEKERASGVFLSVLGFGTGNLKDSTMEKLADKGNGNYGYIDSLTEGRKVLVEQMGATLFTIAKDVKIQVEFNPARVTGYRLIGYENRLLAKEDFNDDKKDAGEIGAGHTVTALYEIIPAGQPLPDRPSVDPLKYQPAATPNAERSTSNAQVSSSTDLLTVKLRYKAPDGDTSKLIEVPLNTQEIPAFAQATSDFQFAAAVAAFGMKLRGSPTAGDIGWNDIQKIVRGNLGEDPGSYRAEFLTLIEKATRLKPAGRTPEE